MSLEFSHVNYPIRSNIKIIIALDYSNKKSAMQLINFLDPSMFRVKIGQEMFIRFGIKFIEEIHNLGFKIFLDLKLYDIPNTIAKSIYALSNLNIWMLSIHACGGINMLKNAKIALNRFQSKKPLLIAITLLTSISESELKHLGITLSLSNYILKLAKLSCMAGLDGVVCSAKESNQIKRIFGDRFKTIVPGIRFSDHMLDDQKMIFFPQDIKKYNIDYLVVGRIITHSNNPIQALKKFLVYLK
ncbi:orotidine-5'-phosphate decarboxylase [Buchnera aphidicola]|uniref:orotidine-5'-phosphate decarboxylase n=1 Tax=Buchnera aphidicola TaxID=9 RepID=UPI003463939A